MLLKAVSLRILKVTMGHLKFFISTIHRLSPKLSILTFCPWGFYAAPADWPLQASLGRLFSGQFGIRTQEANSKNEFKGLVQITGLRSQLLWIVRIWVVRRI